MNIIGSLAISVLLIFVTAFFVAAEFAIIRVRKTKINELADQGVAGAAMVRRLLDRLDVYLSGTQLGVTMASLGLGRVGEPVMEHFLVPLFRALHLHLGRVGAETLSFILGLAFITFFAVVFGELLPKWTVIQHSERVACLIAYPMNAYIRVFYPFIWVLEKGAGTFARAFGVNPSKVGTHESAHSEDEIMAIVEAAERSGTIRSSEAQIVDNVFEFAHTQARNIMVPRVNMVALSTKKSVSENVAIAVAYGFTRFPLVEGDADHVIGMIHIKDLLSIASDPSADILSIKREMLIVPETKPIDELLRELQKSHSHQALVMDEYGGTAGLVTLEDILEELVGEIQDEYDRPSLIEQISDDEFLVSPTVPLRDLSDQIGLEIKQDTDYESIGGYTMYDMHLPPELGATVQLDGFDVTVAEMTSNHRVRRLKFLRRHNEQQASDAPAG